jgi:hypothetical protein
MPVVALIAASALAAAQWASPVVADDDYPGTALLKSKSAAAMIELLVDPAGKVVKCTQSAAVGDEQLASQMCNIAKRKKATPARDAAGKPAFGFRRVYASLTLPGTQQADEIDKLGPAPDVDIEVASIPAGSPSPVLVNVIIGVDQAGKTTGCEYTRGGLAAAFGKVACEQVKAMPFDKLTDADGSAVSYVRPVSVRFSLATKKG